jgi:plasmid stabilization system protein ParE
MSYRIHTTAQAETDIERIFTWLATRSPQGAARWYESFWDAAERGGPLRR